MFSFEKSINLEHTILAIGYINKECASRYRSGNMDEGEFNFYSDMISGIAGTIENYSEEISTMMDNCAELESKLEAYINQYGETELIILEESDDSNK